MEENLFSFKAKDLSEIMVYKWLPEEKPIAVVLIVHGMAEHAFRYKEFAEYLTKSKIAVYAPDLRGHGKTAGTLGNIGYFAEKKGWAKVVEDIHDLRQIIQQQNPSIPFIMFGHSMGSFLARTYVSIYSDINALILSGTASGHGLLGMLGLLLAKFECIIKGGKSKSPILNCLSFGSFNKAFAPARTSFDWLSRDNQQVDKYINDPFCGGIFTTSFFIDLIKGVQYVNEMANINTIPKDLPVLFIAGSEDPVGKQGKGVLEVVGKFKTAGISKVECNLFPGCRHEILNETNKQEVYEFILNWIMKNIKYLG